jgi:hypothetical protein
MISNRIFFTIEQFKMRENHSSALGFEFLVSGWFHADQDTVGVDLVLDGAATPPFIGTGINLHSPDVAAALGDDAGSKRFHLVCPVAPASVPFERATLCFNLRNGDRCAIEIASIFRNEVIPPQTSFAGLVGQFESLGENREFGFLQHRVGIDRLGLLRNADSPSAAQLAEAMRSRFSGLAAADSLQVSVKDGLWITADSSSGCVFHTGIPASAMTEVQVRDQEIVRLPALARNFLGDIVAGDRIYVRRAPGDDEADIHEMFNAMRRIGPARVLWVVPADGQVPPNVVTKLGEGLYRGTIAQLAPADNLAAVPVESWTALLTEAVKTIVAPAPAPLHAGSAPRKPAGDWALAAPTRPVAAEKRAGWRKLFGNAH